MRFTRATYAFLFMACFLGATVPILAMTPSSGVNLTADEVFGARQQGMGLMRAGFQDGADAVVNSPAGMNDVNDFTFSTAHVERFGGMANFDCAAFLLPWYSDGTLGFAIARYGVDTVEAVTPTQDFTGLFSTADWLIAGSVARRFGKFDVGGTINLLYRDLGDQSGMGLRGDAMAQYTFPSRTEKYRAGAFLRGLVPSTAKWQSGYSEYEAPELSLFASGMWDVPYFYGKLQAGFETPGLVEKGGRSANGLEGERAVTDPMSLLKTSKLGAEFLFDFGLRLRRGFVLVSWSSGLSMAAIVPVATRV